MSGDNKSTKLQLSIYKFLTTGFQNLGRLNRRLYWGFSHFLMVMSLVPLPYVYIFRSLFVLREYVLIFDC